MPNRPTAPHRRPTRVVLFTNRLEDRIPGRAAYVLHRSRTAGRTRTIDGMRLLEEWARRRAERLADDSPVIRRRSDVDHADPNDADPESSDTAPASDSHDSDAAASEDAHLAEVARPDDSWTKGRIYELAQALDVEGRSKMNKADLLDAVLDAIDERDELDGPRDPVYAEPRTPVSASH